MATTLYNVTGTVNPKCLPSESDCEGYLVTDANGDDREVNFCFGNVDQGCWVYVSTQVRARSEQAAVAMVSKVVGELLLDGAEEDDCDLSAEETSDESDYGV